MYMTAAKKSTGAKKSPAKRSVKKKVAAAKAAGSKTAKAESKIMTKGKTKVKAKGKTKVKVKSKAKVKVKGKAKVKVKGKAKVKIGKVPQEITPLTPKELEYFRVLLLRKRKELLGDVDQMASESLDGNRQDASGELSNMPIHMADIGTDNYEQEFTLGLIESERRILRDIDRALSKFAGGTYGTCEGTGGLIERPRLEAKPEARYCIDYARKVEQGLVPVHVNDDVEQ